MNETLLEVKEISKHFGGVKALDKVNLSIKKGEIHCLVGENGCGKSTLIKVISGFYKPAEERLFMTERRIKIWASTSLSSLESRSSIRICLFFPI